MRPLISFKGWVCCWLSACATYWMHHVIHSGPRSGHDYLSTTRTRVRTSKPASSAFHGASMICKLYILQYEQPTHWFYYLQVTLKSGIFSYRVFFCQLLVRPSGTIKSYFATSPWSRVHVIKVSRAVKVFRVECRAKMQSDESCRSDNFIVICSGISLLQKWGVVTTNRPVDWNAVLSITKCHFLKILAE